MPSDPAPARAVGEHVEARVPEVLDAASPRARPGRPKLGGGSNASGGDEPSGGTVVRTEGLRRSYGDARAVRHALDGVSLSIEAGELVAVLDGGRRS